ncbi:hypothetical protein BPP43_06690 [Brachyspira pilosicoli P43/6/78]|uniref:Uncharacterized protein n=1 Tax=Brachyspira pilosicoli P43/6/78 TaxID=1042417 RepID=A0A3B6VN82_BRAPL|nr:hypothetical protein BPP43_06690 [Brachyspira pilosicoli P43/6/78]
MGAKAGKRTIIINLKIFMFFIIYGGFAPMPPVLLLV